MSQRSLGRSPAVAVEDVRPCARGRKWAVAFTLIELLVVVSIMMLLMGLAIGSVVRGPKVNALVGAEQALAGAVRQARHTARTSGQPVVLLLSAKDGTIAGLLRTPLWSRSDDWPGVEFTTGSGPEPAPGRTGEGLVLPEAFAPGQDAIKLAGGVLSGPSRLARGVPSAAQVGAPRLLLSAWVRPPLAGLPHPEVIPVVHVGDEEVTPTAAFGSVTNSAIGLLLLRADGIGATATATQQTTAGAKAPTTPTWEVLGWIIDSGGQRHEVSSVLDAPRDQSRAEGTVNLIRLAGGAVDSNYSGEDLAGPLVGGSWTELTLLFDRGRLVLYRDGRRVGEKLIDPAPTALRDAGPDGERVFVGHVSIPSVTVAAAPGGTVQLDDARLERLGTELAGRLPGGVLPLADRVITCHPDGRVEVDAGTDANTDILLRSNTGDAVITVSISGQVASRVVLPEVAP